MAQSAITVTPPNPTPPTNFSFLGQTPPNAPAQPAADDGTAASLLVFAPKIASVDNTLFPSVDAEGRGTEVSVTAPGSRPEAPTISVSDLGNYTTAPNRDHASSLSPATNPVIGALTPSTTTSGTGTFALTVAGTGYTKQSQVFINDIPQTTVYVGPTSLTVAAALKKTTAGTFPVRVVTGNAVTTASTNMTYT